MEVILLDKVQNLGALGDEVRVRSGYARNFLIPQGKAVMATKENRAHFDERRKDLEAKAAEILATAQARADKINGSNIEIAGRAGDEGKLFGSIGTADIAAAVSSAAGIEIGKQEVQLPEGPLRNVGEYKIEFNLHADVVAAVTINVVPE